MMKHMFFGYSNGLTALIALTLGYIVCTLANKEKGILRKAGYIIGVSVIVISSVIIVGKVLCTAAKGCPLSVNKPQMQMEYPQK